MSNKFMSVSLMTNQHLTHHGRIDEKFFIEYFIKKLHEVSSYKSEVIVILCNEESKNFYLNQEFESYDNVDLKFVFTHKKSKLFSLHNLGWKSSIGDIICHYDIPLSNTFFVKSTIESIINQMLNMNSHLVFIDEDLHQNNKRDKIELYKLFNDEYKENRIPVSTHGFIVTRQAINTAFSIEAEISDPFISLAVSGMTASTLTLNNGELVKHQQRYDTSNIEELLLQYTKNGGLSFIRNSLLRKFNFLHLVISSVLLLIYIISLFINSTNQSDKLFITSSLIYLSCTAIGILFIYINSYLKSIYILQQHTLAAARDKQLVGQIIVVNR